MPKVRFTYALKPHFPGANDILIEAKTIKEAIETLEGHFPGLRNYLLNDDGSVRKHVNIFHNQKLIHDRNTLTDVVSEASEIYIMQALSGG